MGQAPWWLEFIAQGIGIVIATVWIRTKATKDTNKVIQSTAAQSTSNDILNRVEKIEKAVETLKANEIKEHGTDHRAPSRE